MTCDTDGDSVDRALGLKLGPSSDGLSLIDPSHGRQEVRRDVASSDTVLFVLR